MSRLLFLTALLVIGCLPEQQYASSGLIGKPPATVLAERVTPSVASDVAHSTPRVPLLATPEQEANWRKFWPKSSSKLLNTLKGKDLIFYDDSIMPRSYQVWDEGRNSGLALALPDSESANNEFPWVNPAGLVSGSNFEVIRFVHLPAPIEWWRAELANGTFSRYAWEYHSGTVFGELLAVADPLGHDHVFELRTRRKKPDAGWTMNVYRPFPSEGDLRAALEKRGYVYPNTAEFVFEHALDSRFPPTNHVRNAFIDTARMTYVPPMSMELVNDLLDRAVFHSAKGNPWRVDIEAPTTDSYSIVPDGYLGGFIPINDDSCMRCHVDAGKVVNLSGERRWRLRGGDGIFSFSPLTVANGKLILNPKLVNVGLLAHKDGAP